MQRSRSRKLARLARETNTRPAQQRFAKLVRHASIGAAVVASISAARAQQADTNGVGPAANMQIQQIDSNATSANPAAAPAAGDNAANEGGLQEVVVTATKSAENIQSIPMTVTAVTGAQLSNQNVTNFQQLAIQNPQIQFISSTPTNGAVFMRGINGAGGGFTGGQGSVSVYLNEQPITVGGSQVQWHIYDMARVETLPGPQGTLYGAQAEVGTLREITNQPDPSHFSASYTGQLNTIDHGTLGGIAEGFVNIPITESIAARFVAWYERDSGFVNNVPQSITFDNGTTINNAPFVQNHFNPVTVEGGRAMFTFRIGDDWSINPTIMTQRSRWDGDHTQEDWKDLSAGPAIPSEYAQALYAPSTGNDSAVDYTLTVLGKIGDFNITFASGYMQRDTRTYAEYVDYSLAYQSIEPFVPKNPMMYDPRWNDYEMLSNELRVTTPAAWPVHGTVGLYQDREQNLNYLNEPIPGLDPTLEVGYGTPYPWSSTVYLDNLETVQRDWAAFAEFNWDITSHFTATAGFRRFRYDNTIQGFYGYSAAYATTVFGAPSGVSGEELCTMPYTPFNGAPCQDENQRSEAWGSVPRFTLSYKFDPDHLVYATFSKGYRPGGPNRTYGVAPYLSDFLTNYEVGWKSAWFDHHLIFNGDAYVEVWKNYQFGFTGPNGIGVTANAASAQSKGWDEQLQWLVVSGLTFTFDVSYADAYLTANYCKHLGSNGEPITTANCVGPGHTTPSTPLAFDGGRLPDDSVWSGFASLRYSFPFANGTAFVEGDQSYKSFYWTNVEPQFQVVYGQVPSYGLTNLSLGIDKNNWELELLVSNLFNRDAIINKAAELQAAAALVEYNYITPPRLIGLQFTQNF